MGGILKMNMKLNRTFLAYYLALGIIIAPVSAAGTAWFDEPVYKNMPYVQYMHDKTFGYFGIKDIRSSLQSAHEKISNTYGSLLIKTSLRLYLTQYLSRGAATRFLLSSCFGKPRWWIQLGIDLVIGSEVKPLEEILLDSFVGYFIPQATAGDYRLPYEYAKELAKHFYLQDTPSQS